MQLSKAEGVSTNARCTYNLATTGSCSALWLRLFYLSFKQPYRSKFLQTGRV